MGSPDPLVEAGRAPWKRWRVNSAFKYLEMQRIGVWGRVNAQRWDAVLPSGNVWKAEPKRKRQECRMGWSVEGILGGPNCLALSGWEGLQSPVCGPSGSWQQGEMVILSLHSFIFHQSPVLHAPCPEAPPLTGGSGAGRQDAGKSTLSLAPHKPL